MKYYGKDYLLQNQGVYKTMAVTIEKNENTLTAFIEGDIDHHTAKEVRTLIDDSIERINPKTLKLDFSKVDFMDSSGIGLIMGRFRLMKLLNGRLKVINLPKHIEKIIKLSGLESFGIIE